MCELSLFVLRFLNLFFSFLSRWCAIMCERICMARFQSRVPFGVLAAFAEIALSRSTCAPELHKTNIAIACASLPLPCYFFMFFVRSCLRVVHRATRLLVTMYPAAMLCLSPRFFPQCLLRWDYFHGHLSWWFCAGSMPPEGLGLWLFSGKFHHLLRDPGSSATSSHQNHRWLSPPLFPTNSLPTVPCIADLCSLGLSLEVVVWVASGSVSLVCVFAPSVIMDFVALCIVSQSGLRKDIPRHCRANWLDPLNLGNVA